MSQSPGSPSAKTLRNCLVGVTPLLKIPLCMDKRPMARAHKHGFLLLTCTEGGTAEGEPVLAFVVLRASAIEWYVDEVTARTAGPSLGELTLTSRSVVHEESRPSAPPRKGSPAVSGGDGFAEALERDNQVIEPIYIAMVRAGEASGKLEVVLRAIVQDRTRREQLLNWPMCRGRN